MAYLFLSNGHSNLDASARPFVLLSTQLNAQTVDLLISIPPDFNYNQTADAAVGIGRKWS